jgi:hypothetical protein
VDVSGAVTALAGTALGAGVTLAVEWVRARTATRTSRREALLTTCSNFTAAVARARSLCFELNGQPENQQRVRLQMEEARVECERLRLLVEAKETQRAARMAIRHLWAVWHLATKGTNPRADEYPGVEPYQRLREALTQLYVGVRRETGSLHPTDVFEDLD